MIKPIIVVLLVSELLAQMCKPWGIRLSFGDHYMDSSSDIYLYIGFNTNDTCIDSYVSFQNKNVSCTSRIINTTLNFTTYSHSCSIKNLQFNGDYYNSSYIVIGVDSASKQNPSDNISFKLINKNIENSFQNLVLGDWGIIYQNVSSRNYYDIIPILKNYTQNNVYGFVLFLGDIAYDFCDQKSKTAKMICDQYYPMMVAMEFLTSQIPFMPTVGNHEYGPLRPNCNLLYRNTFWVPSGNIDTYFFEVGKLHFQTFNAFEQSEGIAVEQDTTNKVNTLIDFYKRKGKNIEWIVPFGHYPFYCQGYLNDTGCNQNIYVNNLKLFSNYFYTYKIDVYYGAHIHLFDRTYPVNKLSQLSTYKDKSNSNQKIYYNPGSPVYIYQGSAGNSYYVETQLSPLSKLEASQYVNTGFSIMIIDQKAGTFQNQHIYGQNGTIAESFIVQKDQQAWISYLILGISIVIFIGVLVLLYFLIKKTKKPLGSQVYDTLVSQNAEKV